jgi:sensor histidine kinase YesM
MSKHRTEFSFTYAGSPANKQVNAMATIASKINALKTGKAQANTNAERNKYNQQILKYKKNFNNARQKYRNILRAKIAAIREEYHKLNIANLENAMRRGHVTRKRGRGA